jgi:hypothetical protein
MRKPFDLRFDMNRCVPRCSRIAEDIEPQAPPLMEAYLWVSNDF